MKDESIHVFHFLPPFLPDLIFPDRKERKEAEMMCVYVACMFCMLEQICGQMSR